MVHILSGNSLYISIVSYLLYLSIMLSNLSNLLYHVYVMYVMCMMYVCNVCVMCWFILGPAILSCLLYACLMPCIMPCLLCVSLGAPYVVGRSPDLMVVRTGQKKTPNRYRPGFLIYLYFISYKYSLPLYVLYSMLYCCRHSLTPL